VDYFVNLLVNHFFIARFANSNIYELLRASKFVVLTSEAIIK